jgi:hypothetical protein
VAVVTKPAPMTGTARALRIALVSALAGATVIGGACLDGAHVVTHIPDPAAKPGVDLDGDGVPDGPNEGEGEGTQPDDPRPFVPAEARMRRLLSWQYTNALRDILGDDAAAVVTPPADVPLNGFYTVGAASLSMTPVDIERVEQSAFAAAQIAVHGASNDAVESWRTCAPSGPSDSACMEQLVAAVGKKAYRRALTPEERARWVAVGMNAATAYGDFDLGLEFAVAGLFQSPNFLYQIELGVPVDGDEARRRLSGVEIASRLSFFLLGTTPSDGLLQAGERGDLDDEVGLSLYAETMLADPRAKAALRQFFDEKLQLAAMLAVVRDADGYDDSLQALLREETLAYVDDIVWTRNADARELLSSDFTYVNDELASYYGIPLPGSGANFARVTVSAGSKRGGLLTQGAFLSRFAHERRTSPTLRGKFVREALMCQSIGAPPDDVDTTLPEPTEQDMPETTRDRIAQHATDERCAACHSQMDPIGFALESFDETGRLRTHEVGLPINDAGEVDGTVVDGPRGLSAYLREDPTVPLCLVRNLFRHATGHIEDSEEEPGITPVDHAFEDSGYRMKDALLAMVVSDAFRFVRSPSDGGAP